MNFLLLSAITTMGICVTFGLLAINFGASNTIFFLLNFYWFIYLSGKVGIMNLCPLDLPDVTGLTDSNMDNNL